MWIIVEPWNHESKQYKYIRSQVLELTCNLNRPLKKFI